MGKNCETKAPSLYAAPVKEAEVAKRRKGRKERYLDIPLLKKVKS